MPLDPAIRKILVIGAGPIIIGQGCEFDYSGTQACKALKEEGCQVILLNSNPATIMTDNDTADAVFIEPMTLETLEDIIANHRPDSLLPTVGGQTALNLAREAANRGILQKYGVNLIGLYLDTIEKAENREFFKREMAKIGIEVPESYYAANWQEVLEAQENIEFPLVVRCSFTLGGHGGGIAYHLDDLKQICKKAFTVSPGVLIEEALLHWKEYELEVMRDSAGNSIVVCGIENIDPMGIHTGDSITVTPIQTLTDKEYQLMRKKAFHVLEAIGMTSGGCNVQFAVHPKTGKMLCIEVNPRVSRSSALASKATGFPIAKIAAKLALGYHLNELKAGNLPASFEPVIDYVVTKIPRFDFHKFPTADATLSTRMKSTGQAMAFGSTFLESFNKARESSDATIEDDFQDQTITEKLKNPKPERLWHVQKAIKNGITTEEIHRLAGYDPWFLEQIAELVNEEKTIRNTSIEALKKDQLFHWKQMGFSDIRLSTLLNCSEEQIVQKRHTLNIHPVYKRIDSCSAEFPNDIACLYSTYEDECESNPTEKQKIVVLGSGPNRIGQGIEFDHCCVHAIKTIKSMGYEAIIINCNPDTVSTDYDIADKLYFEPLTSEHLEEVLRIEKPMGLLIQFGGQTPLNLHQNSVPILGTPMTAIDVTEDRQKFRSFIEKIGLTQPRNNAFSTKSEAQKLADRLGFPLICRPSYVTGGAAMQIIRNHDELQNNFPSISLRTTGPILIEEFLEGALEVEVDAICDGKEIFICGIIEHVEPAGIHSGDSRCYLSPYKLTQDLQEALIEQAKVIALSLDVVGLFNVQFAIRKGELFVLEANLRASRTIPLLTKTTGIPLVQVGVRCILGQSLQEQGLNRSPVTQRLGLKLPVFPFSQLNIITEPLGPQMKSIGEVLCLGNTHAELLRKAKFYIALQFQQL